MHNTLAVELAAVPYSTPGDGDALDGQYLSSEAGNADRTGDVDLYQGRAKLKKADGMDKPLGCAWFGIWPLKEGCPSVVKTVGSRFWLPIWR